MSRKASGLKAWIIQRITSLLVAAGVLLFALKLLASPPEGVMQWRAWLSMSGITVLVLLVLFALLWHAWIGMRDVFIDYVHAQSWRLTLLSLLAVYLAACALWGLFIMLGVFVQG
ncbi:MAG: succinate dehydrogenase, hydrophobic membrane anchor protein [gamma proteobacterium symbiont of Bathyaustriella thionipta]|nr:succinate dehydrogenase, hydrophobic membrane anchor protein [gamma proteobacterium symbiont of Bathyaustriella thionipta]MCU7958895.1 succinate dehydrogenase, hydrophobic membrane anchor protein [gamma proteobacterium symbiont of Bathyaustriella thionipta]